MMSVPGDRVLGSRISYRWTNISFPEFVRDKYISICRYSAQSPPSCTVPSLIRKMKNMTVLVTFMCVCLTEQNEVPTREKGQECCPIRKPPYPFGMNNDLVLASWARMPPPNHVSRGHMARVLTPVRNPNNRAGSMASFS